MIRWFVPLVALGCAASAPPPPPATAPAPARRELVIPKARIQTGVSGEQVMVPFGVNQNGTELVYALLERAAAAGRAEVGDLAIAMTFRWRGHVIECRTDVGPPDDPRLARAAPVEGTPLPAGPYGTEVGNFNPQALDVTVEDRELVCQRTRVPVYRKRRVTTSTRDASAKRLMDRDPRRKVRVRTFEDRDACEWKQITRKTTRYDYELKLGFVPPDWDALAARFSDGKLVAARPVCYALAEADVGKLPEYRITATVLRRGPVAQNLPMAPASRNQADDVQLHMRSAADCRRMAKENQIKDIEAACDDERKFMRNRESSQGFITDGDDDDGEVIDEDAVDQEIDER